jgi:predicted nucleotidyltransferase component of viral defense system
MDIENLEQIKKLVIISLFSDDDLLESLVLKGGNALDIVYKVALRASIDLDFSIEREFSEEEINIVEAKIKRVLQETFREEGYEVFDISFAERPEALSVEMEDFWGGYRIEFKIIETQKYETLANDLSLLRRHATVVGPRHKKKFMVDISKFEYCIPKQEWDIEGYTIFVYTPEMIVFEKLRAICQQMPEYSEVVRSPSQSARARDFFDIYTVLENFPIDFQSSENIQLLRNIFEAKKVPLKLIGRIENYRNYHREDFVSVKDTVKKGMPLEDFDYYFDYVLEKCRALEPLWKV